MSAPDAPVLARPNVNIVLYDVMEALGDGCPGGEFRFQGTLGFGGKFWSYGWYVNCYSEDETPARAAVIALPDDRWWCPTSERMVLCPGPCPDGRPHERREGEIFMHHLGDIDLGSRG